MREPVHLLDQQYVTGAAVGEETEELRPSELRRALGMQDGLNRWAFELEV